MKKRTIFFLLVIFIFIIIIVINFVKTDKSLKLDSSKNWVYDAKYKLPTNKESYYGYTNHTKLINSSDLIVPYVNIDSNDAEKVNTEIYNLYEKLIEKFNENLKNEIMFTIVNYKFYVNDDIVSILITTETAGTDISVYDYYTYNFNLKSGKLLKYSEMNKFNDMNEKITDLIVNKLGEMYSGDDFDFYKDKSISNYKATINDNSIKYFIEDGKMNIIVTLEMPIGRGKFDTIITTG